MTATQIYTKNLGIRSNTNLPVYPITIFEGVKNSKNQSLNDVIDGSGFCYKVEVQESEGNVACYEWEEDED